jgi:iron complex outermembrane receptor protein
MMRFIIVLAANLLTVFILRAQDTLNLVTITSEQRSSVQNLTTQEPLVTVSHIPVAQAQTLEQLLRLCPSIDIRERGGKSVQTDIGIRGGSPDQTMIQLNGVDFTDARTGHQSHSLPVDADIIGGIDLIEGIGGNTGLTGAVNVRTRMSGENYLRANLTGGRYGYAYGNLSGSLRTAGDRLTLFGAGSLRRSDGYRPCTDFTNWNTYGRILFESGRAGTFDAQAGWQKRDFGAAGFYSLAYPEQYEKTSTALASLRWMKTAGPFSLAAWGSYRKNYDCFQLIRGDESKVPYNHHQTDNFGAHAALGYHWRGGTTTLVTDYACHYILSTVLGDDIATGAVPAWRLPVPGFDRTYTKWKVRHTGDFFLRHAWEGRRVGLQASLGAAISPYGTAPLWNAHLDWRPAQRWHLDAGVSQSMRLPSFTDLYYTAPGHKGNPDLQPEKALTVKTGLAYRLGPVALGATGFYRRGLNVIDWVRESADADWQCLQLTRLDTWGADLRAEYRSGTWLRSITLLYGHLWSDKESGGMISEYALDYMRNKLSINILLSPWSDRLDLQLTGTLYDRAGNYAAADHTTQSYKPYFLLNGNLGFETGLIKRGSLRLYIEAENILNTPYFDFWGLPMPGLWLNGGLMVRL